MENIFFTSDYLLIPIEELIPRLRERHILYKNIEEISNKYLDNNPEGVKKINEFLYKIFNAHISLFEFEEDEGKVFGKELFNIDSNFELLNDQIGKLSMREKKEIYEKHYNNIVIKSMTISNNMYNQCSSDRTAEKIDLQFYSFINLYVNLSKQLAKTIRESNKEDIDVNIIKTGILFIIYSTIVFVYFDKKTLLTEGILIQRMSELNVLVNVYRHKTSREVQSLLKKSKSVSLF